MRRLLKPAGRLAFTTIHLAPGLDPAQRRRGAVSGPSAVVGPDGRELLDRAGFDAVHVEDVTADFLTAARGWLDARLRHRDALESLDAQAFAARIGVCTSEVNALEAGLLRRSLYVASR